MEDNYIAEYTVKVTLTAYVKVMARDDDEALDLVDEMSDDELKDRVSFIDLEIAD